MKAQLASALVVTVMVHVLGGASCTPPAATPDAGPDVVDAGPRVDLCNAPDAIACSTVPTGNTYAHDADLEALRGCNRLDGDLVIQSADVTSLAALSSLQCVTGRFQLSQTAVVDLTGLERLQSVGFLFVSGNASLTSLGALHALDTALSTFILHNDALTNLSGLERLTTLFTLSVQDNAHLTDLGTFAPTSVGSMDFTRNASLTSLHGLEGITTAFNVALVGLPALTSLDGLAHLGTTNTLTLDELGVTSLSSLASLQSVGTLTLGALALDDLATLTGLTSIQELDLGPTSTLRALGALPSLTVLDQVKVTSNAALETLIIPDGVQRVTLTQVNDAPALTTLSFGKANDAFSVVLDGVPALTTLDASSVTTIGDMELGQTGLVSLSLPAVTTGEALHVTCGGLGGGIANHTPLTSVSAPLLTRLDGDLNVSNCNALTTLDLPQLASTGNTFLTNLPQLTSLSGLSGLANTGSFTLDGTGVTSLAGFAAPHSSTFTLRNDAQLTALDVASPFPAGSVLLLQNLPRLTSLAGLAGSQLAVFAAQSLPAVTSLDGLQDSVQRLALTLDDVPLLTDATALQASTQLAALHIKGTALTSLSLPALVTADDVNLENEPLTTLDAPALTTVTHSVVLTDLPLASLSGLTSLATVGVVTLTNLGITNLDGLAPLAPWGLALNGDAALASLAGLAGDGPSSLSLNALPALSSLDGMPGAHLQALSITACNALTTLAPLSLGASLVQLHVVNNSALTTLAPTLDALTQLVVVEVRANAALTTLSLGALTQVFERFLVRDNPRLPQCQVDAVLAHLHGVDADVITSGNGTGSCN
jgi:hypothetical protein